MVWLAMENKSTFGPCVTPCNAGSAERLDHHFDHQYDARHVNTFTDTPTCMTPWQNPLRRWVFREPLDYTDINKYLSFMNTGISKHGGINKQTCLAVSHICHTAIGTNPFSFSKVQRTELI